MGYQRLGCGMCPKAGRLYIGDGVKIIGLSAVCVVSDDLGIFFMPITITFLGHAGFILEGDGHAVVIDPFLTGNPLAKTRPQDIQCQHIALTHGHADHLGDTVAIAKANNATVYGAFEIAEYVGGQGCNASPGNPGGKIDTPFGFIAFTQAFHSSSFEGQYMGMPCGLIIHMNGVTFYHCGDTSLFGDMKLLGEIYQQDIAGIPIGDRFTMGPALATKAAELISPEVAIPIHYKTFDLLVQDASGFAPQDIAVRVLNPGQVWQYG